MVFCATVGKAALVGARGTVSRSLVPSSASEGDGERGAGKHGASRGELLLPLVPERAAPLPLRLSPVRSGFTDSFRR